jgi:E3 ubiquitin-protein ligase RNF5
MMDFEHEDFFNQKWKADGNSVTETETETEKENIDNCFDCHICLDFAHEPVVTLCGHLFCWSCIYKWLFVQRASLAPDEHPQCPVCKHDISHTKMVPLYGRGQTLSSRRGRNRKATLQHISIPPRPPASEIQSLLETPTSPQSDQQEQENDDTSQVQNLDTLVTPVIPRYMFGNYEDLHHMMANKSLNKISFFLFLCFVLCLILF